MRLHRTPYVLMMSTIAPWPGLLRDVGEGNHSSLGGVDPSLSERAIPSLPGFTVSPNPQRPSSSGWFERLDWVKWVVPLRSETGGIKIAIAFFIEIY